MFVLGLQGSPRKKGNSVYLLDTYLDACRSQGARTEIIETDKLDIRPCRELIVCEKKGFCPLKDEMEPRIYGLIRQADLVVLASPVFFYNVSAQAKILIDRCQMFWGRKYKLGLKDPDAFSRKGVLLAAGASGGKRLFEGVALTAKYFFDAISAEFSDSLTYKKVEAAGAVREVPGIDRDLRASAEKVMGGIRDKKTLLFVSPGNACLGQMAAAYAKQAAQGQVRVLSAGLEPDDAAAPGMVAFMAGQKLDLKYAVPRSLETVLDSDFQDRHPDTVVCINVKEEPVPGVPTLHWDIPAPPAPDAADLEKAGQNLQSRAADLIQTVSE